MIKERKSQVKLFTDRKTQIFDVMVISPEFRRYTDKNLNQETTNKVKVESFQPRELKLWIPKGIGSTKSEHEQVVCCPKDKGQIFSNDVGLIQWCHLDTIIEFSLLYTEQKYWVATATCS